MNQHQLTINLINIYSKKLYTSNIDSVREGYRNKIIGMLSLAKELDIISTGEYEYYFTKIFN